jgi:hypothetical protein
MKNSTLKFCLFMILLSSTTFIHIHSQTSGPSLPSQPEIYEFKDPLTLSPGQSLKKILQEFPTSQLVNQKEKLKTYQYVFLYPHFFQGTKILWQASDDKIVDVYRSFPAHLLHDYFHRTLLKLLGPQTKYIKKEASALYVWNSAEGIVHIYEGQCVLYCFPKFWSSTDKKFFDGNPNEKSLLEGFLLVSPELGP